MKHRLLPPVMLAILAAPLMQASCTSETTVTGDAQGGAGGEGGEVGTSSTGGGEVSSSTGMSDPVCGDGDIQAGEECDDSNTDAGDGCDETCQVELGFNCKNAPSVCASTCGDGVRASDENCDDDNLAGGDGCASDCKVEAGFVCTAGPLSACSAICGDGLILGGESCDDENDDPGDGCSAICAQEAGYVCEGEPSDCHAVLWAAQGGGTSGGFGFYRIDLDDLVIEEIGEDPHSMTGLASDGTTLYGTTAFLPVDGGEGELFTVDRETGERTQLGILDRGQGEAIMAGMTFHGASLFGVLRREGGSKHNNIAVIDVDDVDFEVLGTLGSGGFGSQGAGIASNGQAIYLAPDGVDGNLYSVDPDDGEVTALGNITGCGSGSGIRFGAMAFHSGTLYAVVPQGTRLWSIDVDTRECEEVFDLEVSDIDALASDKP